MLNIADMHHDFSGITAEALHATAETLERKALRSLHAAAPRSVRDRLGMRLEELNGATVSVVPGAASIVLNRTQGLGVAAPARRSDVGAICRAYEDDGVSRFFVHLDSDAKPESLPDWLSAAGLERARGWMKFARSARLSAPQVGSDLEVRQIGGEHADDFGRIVAHGFDLGDGGAPLIGGLADAPGWHLFMSFAGKIPAGTGALFVDGDVGWFDWGATWPEFRRKGSQSALLAARIRKAQALGCRMLITTTGEWVEGDPQHSYRNIERAGFQPVYARPNYAPPKR